MRPGVAWVECRGRRSRSRAASATVAQILGRGLNRRPRAVNARRGGRGRWAGGGGFPTRSCGRTRPDDGAGAHRPVAAGRGVHVAVGMQLDRSQGVQPAAEVGVLAVELDARRRSRGSPPAPWPGRRSCRRRTPPAAQHVLDQQVRGRPDREVVGADQRPPEPVPVVEAVAARQRQQRRAAGEMALDPLDPVQRRAAVGVEVTGAARPRSTAARARGPGPAPCAAPRPPGSPATAAAIAAVRPCWRCRRR